MKELVLLCISLFLIIMMVIFNLVAIHLLEISSYDVILILALPGSIVILLLVIIKKNIDRSWINSVGKAVLKIQLTTLQWKKEAKENVSTNFKKKKINTTIK